MADYHGQTVDILEDCEDSSLAAGLTEVDTGGFLTLASAAQYAEDTHSHQLDYTSLDAAAYIHYDLAQDNVSFGFWWRSGSLSISQNAIMAFVESTAGGYVLRISHDTQDGGNPNRLRFYDGTTYANVNISAGTWYWITVQVNRGAAINAKVYDTSHNQVGSDISLTAINNQINHVSIGNYGTTSKTNEITYYDSFVIDITDWTYPLIGWATGGSSIIPILNSYKFRRL
jgi:hypothetical protein